MRPKIAIRSLLVAIATIAIILSFVLLPRLRESRSRQLFSSEGAVLGSTVDLTGQSFLDSQIGFPGFVCEVNLDGSDERLGEQVRALPLFRGLEGLNAVAVETDVSVGKSFQLDNLRRSSFSFCGKDFVRTIVSNSPEIREIAFFECDTVDDDTIASFAANPSLESVQIDGSRASGTFAMRFASRPGLNRIVLRNSPLTNEGLEAIGKVQGLLYLEIMQSKDELSLFKLRKLQSLRQLELVGFDIEDQAVAELCEALPHTMIRVDGE